MLEEVSRATQNVSYSKPALNDPAAQTNWLIGGVYLVRSAP
jgi:hypothetical protein